MKILSLNVNQFCWLGCWHEKKHNYVEPRNRISFMNNIIVFIKGFLIENEDNIVILQEVPGNSVTYDLLRSIYTLFLSAFDNRIYNIFCPYRENTCEITLAIANKSSNWETNPSFYKITQNVKENKKEAFYENKYIQLSYSVEGKELLNLLGIHMPFNKREKRTTLFWDALIKFSNEQKNLVMIGDFNASINSKIWKNEYKRLLGEKYRNLIPESENTYIVGQTSIDHVLIHKDLSATAYVLKDVVLSDHYPMIAEIVDIF